MKNDIVKKAVIYSIFVLFVLVGITVYAVFASGAKDHGGAMHEMENHVVETHIEEAHTETKRHIKEARGSSHHVAIEKPVACDFDEFVGQNVRDIDLDGIGRPHRVLEPGAMYTMDFLPERVNVFIDDHGVVVKVECG